MELQEFAELVKKLRDWQKCYFVTRDRTILAACRDWERRVDAELQAILNPPQPGLFDEA